MPAGIISAEKSFFIDFNAQNTAQSLFIKKGRAVGVTFFVIVVR